MEKKTVDTLSEETPLSAGELENLCAGISSEVEHTRKIIESRYYEPLAEEAMGPKWQDGVPSEDTQRLLTSVRREADCLHQAARSLGKPVSPQPSWRMSCVRGFGTFATAGTGSGTPRIRRRTPLSIWRNTG